MGERVRPDTIGINLTRLNEAAKKYGKTSNNGDVYIDLTLWRNDEKNEYGKDISIQVKDKDNPQAKIFVGNGWRGDVPYDGPSNSNQQEEEPLPPQGPREYKKKTEAEKDDDMPF